MNTRLKKGQFLISGFTEDGQRLDFILTPSPEETRDGVKKLLFGVLEKLIDTKVI
jgi:hypothetical protein